MIGKKAPNPKKSSSKAGRVGALTAYITNPELKNGHEKCVHFEAQNFITDDLQSQTLEMIALSHEAVRSKDPIDHYVLSWQEGEKPTIQQAREAVQMTMKHLGLEGHQVIWAMHADTDNIHIHIEVNRVHPETFKVVEINKGFQRNAIQQAAAIVEKIQGWKTHDKSRFKTDELGHLITDSKTKLPKIFEEKDKQKAPTGPARDKEIQTGQKSAQRIAIEDGAPIIAQAKSWDDLHEKMAAAGMEYRREGSGAKIYVGDVAVKASDVDRKASFGNLQKRFGLYQPPKEKEIRNDLHNRTQLVTDTRFTTGYDEQNITATGFSTFDTLRDLPRSNLDVTNTTNWQKSKTQNLLQSHESSDNRRTSGVRRGSNSDSTERGARERDFGEVGGRGTQLGGRSISQARRATGGGTERIRSTQANGREKTSHDARVFHQPLKANQSGWHEYIAIRDAQKVAKTHDTIELQRRHGNKRAALAAKQKAERDKLFSGDWRGKGDLKNALKSITAAQQAADKLELSDKHREERKALQAEYKPLPIYKVWKEQPQIVSLTVRPLIDQHIERDKQITVAQTLRSLTNNIDARQHITYQLDRKDVFRDEGRTIAILDLKSDRGIAAALAVAQQKFGNVLTLTGSEAFKKNAVAVAVANNLTCRFADPALDKLREELQKQKYQAERDAIRAERDRAAAEQLEKSKEPAPLHSPSNNHDPGEAVSLDSGPQTLDPIAHAEELPAIDNLADIHKQIDAAKAAADPRSMFANSTTTEADHEAPDHGVIVGSNEQFVAVQRGEAVKLYRTLELTRQLKYDGIDTGHGRFAPGNELTRKNSKDGMRTVLSEEREAVQTEAKRVRDTGHGL